VGTDVKWGREGGEGGLPMVEMNVKWCPYKFQKL
jgi:hypothetical protein